MTPNAYILSHTMNNYEELLSQLRALDFLVIPDDEDVRVAVPMARVEEFADLVEKHLNAPYNYVDIKFPEEHTLYLIFGAKRFVITNKKENDAAVAWAIAAGLPVDEADWGSL